MERVIFNVVPEKLVEPPLSGTA